MKLKTSILLYMTSLVFFTSANLNAYAGVISKNTPVSYKEIADISLKRCKNAKQKYRNPKLIWDIIKIEKKYNVPPSMRGMLLASACMESGYNPNAEGDHRFSKKKKPKAIGLFQMWSWWESKRWGYGIDRRKPLEAAEAYIQHIKKQLKKIRCKFRSKKKRWVAAWVTAIRAPKQGGRCNEKPKHYRLLKKWHRSIIKQRKSDV